MRVRLFILAGRNRGCVCVPVSGAVYLFAWQILRVRVQGTGKMFCGIRNATFESVFEKW